LELGLNELTATEVSSSKTGEAIENARTATELLELRHY
jgi:hypothetical protein